MKIHAPYIYENTENAIRLEIMPNKSYIPFGILYIVIAIISTAPIIGCIISLFLNDGYTLKNYIIIFCTIIGCILFFLLAFYLLKWEEEGKEIFVLDSNKLEHTIIVYPFKVEKRIFHFKTLEIGYQSGIDFNSEEEAVEIGVELDLDKVIGNHPIQFFMDDGEQVVDSERKIPIEVIQKIRLEFFKLKDSNLQL